MYINLSHLFIYLHEMKKRRKYHLYSDVHSVSSSFSGDRLIFRRSSDFSQQWLLHSRRFSFPSLTNADVIGSKWVGRRKPESVCSNLDESEAATWHKMSGLKNNRSGLCLLGSDYPKWGINWAGKIVVMGSRFCIGPCVDLGYFPNIVCKRL